MVLTEVTAMAAYICTLVNWISFIPWPKNPCRLWLLPHPILFGTAFRIIYRIVFWRSFMLRQFAALGSRFPLQSWAGICRISRHSRSFFQSLLPAAAAKRQIPTQGFSLQSGLGNFGIIDDFGLKGFCDLKTDNITYCVEYQLTFKIESNLKINL